MFDNVIPINSFWDKVSVNIEAKKKNPYLEPS